MDCSGWQFLISAYELRGTNSYGISSKQVSGHNLALAQDVGKKHIAGRIHSYNVRWFFACAMAMAASIAGCAGSAGSGPPPPPPPPAITVAVAPTSASVALGAAQQLTATVTNSTDALVNWSVNNVPGGNAIEGVISGSGIYTAPQNMPQPAAVIVEATSQADPTKSATASITITSDVTVSVSPPVANVELGAPQTFIAKVSGSGAPNTVVTWTISGSGCGGTACGSVDANGNYIAPQVLPSFALVTLTARSVADPSKTSAASITITSRFTFAVNGPSSVNAGATATYVATLTPVPNSNPGTAISWSVSGAGCSGSSCGTLSVAGATAVYQAPAIAPSPSSVTLTATPAADGSRAASASVTIIAQVSVVVAPTSATVALGATQIFTAQVSGASDTSVTWDVNGVTGGNAAVGTVTNNGGSTSTIYTAPVSLPSPSTVTIHATSAASPGAIGHAAVTITSTVLLALTPLSSTRAVGHRQLFTATVTGTTNTTVTWQINGIPGGNTTVGQICVVASNPCQQVSTVAAGSVEYLAPAATPTPNPVTLLVTSGADASQSASAQIAVISHIALTVSPPNATVPPNATQTFVASVIGTDNQSVTWNVSGAAYAGVGSPCGTITPTGVFTAPISTPSPNSISIIATSSEDTSRTGTSSISIATTAIITRLLPASIFAGAAGVFTLRVQGGNFVPTSPGPGSVILIAGTARVTNCDTRGDCTSPFSATDLAAVGTVSIQIRNPDSTLSNVASFVVAQEVALPDVIALTSASPSATGKDIAVVDPSTLGSLAPQPNITLSVAAMGLFSVADNTCALGAGPLVLTRPATGTAIVDICVFSVSGLDPSFAYAITGPATPDISIVGAQPLGLGIVDLTISISSTAAPGSRSLFVQNSNKDKAVASGPLEVK